MDSSGSDTDRAGARLRLHVPAEASELSGIRRNVRSHVAESGDHAEVADDLELVVSELATNVIEHTESRLTITLERIDDDWVLEVSDVDDLDILDDVALPDPGEISGRGLFVVGPRWSTKFASSMTAAARCGVVVVPSACSRAISGFAVLLSGRERCYESDAGRLLSNETQRDRRRGTDERLDHDRLLH